MIVAQHLFCVGSSGLVREISAVAPKEVRVRWAVDAAAFVRAVGGLDASAAWACISAVGETGVAALDLAREAFPAARRLTLVDACDLKIVRDLLESGRVTDLLYRPLDMPSLAAALGSRGPAQRPALTRAARAGSRG